MISLDDIPVVQSTLAPEDMGKGHGYYYWPYKPTEGDKVGPFVTQIEMVEHAMNNVSPPFRWFVKGYDK